MSKNNWNSDFTLETNIKMFKTMVFIPSKITVDHADGTQDVISIPKEGEGLDQGEDFSKTGVSRVIVKKYFFLKNKCF